MTEALSEEGEDGRIVARSSCERSQCIGIEQQLRAEVGWERERVHGKQRELDSTAELD